MTRVERADDFDEHATSKRPLARGIRTNDAGLRAMRSVPSSSRRRATTTNRRLLNAARTAITHVGKRLKKKVENCKKNVTQKIEASILIPWGFIVSIAHFPGAEGFDFPSPFDSEIGFK